MEQEKQVIDSLAPNWVYYLSALAGFVGFLEEIQTADTWKIKLLKFASRMFSSALAAILTYHVIRALGVPESWHIPLIGIGAHMGVETLKELGKLWKQKLGISDAKEGEK